MILALLPLDDPSPWGYMNLYEEGDIWEKVRSCAECENGCCGSCPLSSDKGCYLHLINRGQDKPYHCVVHPSPLKHKPKCILEYECVKGIFKGMIRKQSEPKNVLFYKDGKRAVVDEKTIEKTSY